MGDKKILVTGGAGFIGHYLVDELIRKGYKVRVVDNLSKGEANNIKKHFKNPNFEFVQADLDDLATAKKALEGCDICFHLAAKIGGIGYFHKYPATILRDNNLLTANMFEAARDSKAKIVYMSSSMVFERAVEYPSPEIAIETSPPPISAYGFSKLAGEYIARAYHKEFGIPFVIARPFNAYGPGELVGDYIGYSHVIPDLIKKAMSGQYPLEILGDGEQTRCYTFVGDLAEGVALAGEKAKNDDFNIGTDKETNVKELAGMVWKVCGRKETLKFKHLPAFKHDVRKRVPNISKAKKVLGWEPKTSLDEGLKITFDWLKPRL